MKVKLLISTEAIVFLAVGATAFAAGVGGGGTGASGIGSGAAPSPATSLRPAPGPGLPGINPALAKPPCIGAAAGAPPANQNSTMPNSAPRLSDEDQRLLGEIKRADDKLAEVGNPSSAGPAQSDNNSFVSNSRSAQNQKSTLPQNSSIPQTTGSSTEGPSSNPKTGRPGGC
jgi:hypothetical protein